MIPYSGDASAAYRGNTGSIPVQRIPPGSKGKFKVDIDVLKRFSDRLDGEPRPNKTHLASAVDIRWDRFLVYFNHLLRNGHIESVDENDEGSAVFRKTTLGRDLFTTVEKLHELLTHRKPLTVSSIVAMMAATFWIAMMHL